MVATLTPPVVPPTTHPWATTSISPSALAGRGTWVRYTVQNVLKMIGLGIIPEDATTELLNGLIVHVDRSATGGDPTMHSPGHSKPVSRLTALVSQINTSDRRIQIQLPVVCGNVQMPEPDFAVVFGSDELFTKRLPAASDTQCVIEVADSSLERDRYEKGPMYAAAGIQQYIILNLRNRTAEVYSSPDAAAGTYPPPQIVSAEASLELRVGNGETVSVALASLLP